MSTEIIKKMIDAGWHIIPLQPGTKRPHDQWPSWPDNKLTVDQVDYYSDFGMKIPENVAVVDIDHPELKPKGLPRTWHQATARGLHAFYETTTTPPFKWPWGECKHATASKSHYVKIWHAERLWQTVGEIAPLPDMLGDNTRNNGATLDAGLLTTPKAKGFDTNTRNIDLTSLAGKLCNAGIDEDKIRVFIKWWNNSYTPPLSDNELNHTVFKSLKRWIQEGYEEEQPTIDPTQIEIITAEQLQAMDIPPQVFYGAGMAQGSAIFFYAFTGDGKSAFVLWELKTALQTDKRALIIDNEMTWRDLQARFGVSSRENIDFTMLPERNQFMQLDYENMPYDVIVLDTLAGGYTPPKGTSENDAAFWQPCLTGLKKCGHWGNA